MIWANSRPIKVVFNVDNDVPSREVRLFYGGQLKATFNTATVGLSRTIVLTNFWLSYYVHLCGLIPTLDFRIYIILQAFIIGHLLSMCIHAMPMYLLNCDWLKEIVMWGSCVPYLSRSASILFLVSWVCFYFIRCWKSPFLCFLCPWPLPGVKDLIVSQTSRVFYLTSSIKRIYIRSWWRRVLPAKLPTRGMRVPDRAQWLAQRWERFPVFHSIVIL